MLARKTIVGLIGGTIAIAGVAMLALPGPGWLAILLGLLILAEEFIFARRIILKLQQNRRFGKNFSLLLEKIGVLKNKLNRKKEGPK